MKYADYIKEIEIDSLWSGKKHIVWTLDPHVNVLSGINGVGKSTILNKVVRSVNTNGDVINHLLKGVHITVEPADATHASAVFHTRDRAQPASCLRMRRNSSRCARCSRGSGTGSDASSLRV